MGGDEEAVRVLAVKFAEIFSRLDERQRRLLLRAEARTLGRGGIRLVAWAAGVREATVSLGVDDLDSGAGPLGRARRPGDGRKRLSDLDPGLRPALLALVEPDERGDPMSPLRWTTRLTRNLTAELTRQGHRAGADTVGAHLLRREGFSLQGNAKTIEGQRHPGRDAQFRYVNEQVKDHQGTGDPVISVDTKKKELVGEFKNGGREWRPKGEPEATRTHDSPGDSTGQGGALRGLRHRRQRRLGVVGTDHDTAAFAVESIRHWWKAAGSSDYPAAQADQPGRAHPPLRRGLRPRQRQEPGDLRRAVRGLGPFPRQRRVGRVKMRHHAAADEPQVRPQRPPRRRRQAGRAPGEPLGCRRVQHHLRHQVKAQRRRVIGELTGRPQQVLRPFPALRPGARDHVVGERRPLRGQR
jgi:Rhodopirellula transposase DDE domain